MFELLYFSSLVWEGGWNMTHSTATNPRPNPPIPHLHYWTSLTSLYLLHDLAMGPYQTVQNLKHPVCTKSLVACAGFHANDGNFTTEKYNFKVLYNTFAMAKHVLCQQGDYLEV